MTDSQVKTMWDELEDVLFIENDNGELVIDNNWKWFKKGTSQMDIWHWFDEHFSKGVHWLLYGEE